MNCGCFSSLTTLKNRGNQYFSQTNLPQTPKKPHTLAEENLIITWMDRWLLVNTNFFTFQRCRVLEVEPEQKNMHLEPKWGLLLWLEFRPCLVRLIFKNRSYLGSRYIYIIYIYTSKIQWTPPTKNEIKPLPQNETLTKIYGIRKPGSLEEMSLVESGPQGFEESLWPSYICIGHIWYMWT